MNLLTAQRVREILDYCPVTGRFTRRYRPDFIHRAAKGANAKFAGKIAGTINKAGYVQMWVDGKLCLGHRVAWLIMTGEWPENEVDHRDCNRANNKRVNLRHATPSQNKCNRGATITSTSGYKGVSFDKRAKKWRATIARDGKRYDLGRYGSAEEAYGVYCSEAIALHGEFARLT